MNLIQQLEKEQQEKLSAGREIPDFEPGDTVIVNVKVVEGERTRIQAYEGVCIGRSGGGLNESFTVRKISYGEGVERVFPLYSPMVDSIKLVRRGKVRRAKLYYLRNLRGKSARIAEGSHHGGQSTDVTAESGEVTGSDNRIERKKAGLSGLFHARMVAAILLIASTMAVIAEPLAIEVTDVTPFLDERIKQPVIAIKMAPASATRFAELTTQNVGRKLELRIDGKTVMAPIIREPIMTGSVQVSGGWTLQETKDLADRIAAGKSKIAVEIVNE